MNKIQRKLECSKAIRSLLKAHGASLIYNNLYGNGTRTVKCYAGQVDQAAIRDKITDLANLFDLDVVVRTTTGRKWGAPGFIAKMR